MNFDDSPEESAFRAAARDWLRINRPEHAEDIMEMPVPESLAQRRAWQNAKASSGWACIDWPEAYGGRGASLMQQAIWAQEEGPLAHMTRFMIVGLKLASSALMKHGTMAQCTTLLPRIARGKDIWCQLFSEPVAGSDLAGIGTRAERSDDAWVINGQKIWTSYAHVADRAILLARTDPGKPKHKGLTFFYLDMKSLGVEVRPIRQISGDSTFNEVFLTDVRIPDEQRIGDVDGGWGVALSTLLTERGAVGDNFGSNFENMYTCLKDVQIAGQPALADPVVRDRLADFYVNHVGLRNTNLRLLSALSRGHVPGPEASIGKLVMASQRQQEASFMLDVQEQAGILLSQDHAQGDDFFQKGFFRFAANRIEGGTDEILRNIIAERVLGLPADVRLDKDIPFNQTKDRS